MSTLNNTEEKLIFTIGRMNPPTSGHQGLIRTMMEEALHIGLNKIYIILSASVDKMKNPLKCSTKKELLVDDDVSNIVDDLKRKWIAEKTENIEKIRTCKVIVICMDNPDINSEKYGRHPILKCLRYILDKWEGGHKKTESMLFVGEDRMNDYGWISEYASDNLGRLTIVPVSRPSGAISATYVRGLAMDNNLEGFLMEMENIGIKRERGQDVYLEIRRTLGHKLKSHENSKKTEKITKLSKKRTLISTTPENKSSMEMESIGSRTRSSTRRKHGL